MIERRSILVVDDDPAVVEFLCESLSERGYETAGVTSAGDALAHLRRAPVDLVLSDIEMPRMRRTELLQAILAARPTQLVILITAFGSIDAAAAAVKAGACDFVAKPFTIESLIHAIERAFKERQLRREIVRLRAQHVRHEGAVVAEGAAMRKAVDLAHRTAATTSSVLISGETGSGKSMLARFIHEAAGPPGRPLVEVACSTLPHALAEKELFGAGAPPAPPGAFAAAAGGTLLLEEVGDLPLEAQAGLVQRIERGAEAPGQATRASSPPPAARSRRCCVTGTCAPTSITA